MAETQKFQWVHKQAENAYVILHPETDASIVSTAVAGLTSTNVDDALAELYGLINSNIGGGVVTGVKGDAETEYRLGDVNITAANIGLGNVDNTSDADKPVSTATQAAIDAVEAKIPTDTVTSEELLAVELASGATLKFTEDTSAYVYTLGLYNSQGTLLGDEIEVDLPVEQLVMSVVYNADDKAIIVTLENGNTTEIPVADLVDGLVSDATFEAAVDELNGRIDTINTAEQNVEEAVKTAQAAAETAQSAADAAQAAADTAESHVTTVQATAEAAAADATQALSDAAAAQSAAETAQATADSASTAAATAQSGVDAINTQLSAGVTGSYSAVNVTGGIVTAGQNMIEYWESGVESSDTLAIGGIAIREV